MKNSADQTKTLDFKICKSKDVTIQDQQSMTQMKSIYSTAGILYLSNRIKCKLSQTLAKLFF